MVLLAGEADLTAGTQLGQGGCVDAPDGRVDCLLDAAVLDGQQLELPAHENRTHVDRRRLYAAVEGLRAGGLGDIEIIVFDGFGRRSVLDSSRPSRQCAKGCGAEEAAQGRV